jgi:hypothetical protein
MRRENNNFRGSNNKNSTSPTDPVRSFTTPEPMTNTQGEHVYSAKLHDVSTDSAHYDPTTPRKDQIQGIERPPSEELRVEYERFRSGDPACSHSYVVQFVETLLCENRKLGERCEDFEKSLAKLQQQAEKVLWSMDPVAVKMRTSTTQPNISGILRFVFDEYKSELKVSKDLQQQMEKMDRSHQSELKNMHEKVNQKELEWVSVLSKQENDHKHKIDTLEIVHKDKIDTLEIVHKDKIDALGAVHKELEEEKARLQDALLSAADKFRPISDRDFAFQFNVLKNSVATLARPPLEVDAERLGEAFGQIDFVRTLHKRHYKFVLESAIWATLVNGIFSTPFKVFGPYGERFTAAWIQFNSISKHGWIRSYQTEEILNQIDIAWPQPETFSEKWRSLAVGELRSTLSRQGCIQPFAGDAKRSYEDNVAMVSVGLAESLSRVCSQEKTKEIRDIVDKACCLAMDMGMQRSRLQLFAPRLSDKVSRHCTKTYTEVNCDNEPETTSGTVRLVVRPGLRKMGDGRGDRLDQTTDLCPAGLYLV